MDNRYLEMIRRVEPHLGERIPPNKYIAEDLRHKIATSPWTINFDQVSDTYNAFFWKRNFWKAAYFFSYEYSLTAVTLNRLKDCQNLDVTVVGSGAGSDVLALMTWFNNAFPFTKLTLTLIDQSQKQLDKMALFIKETTELIDQITVSVRYLHMDSEQWQPTVDSADVLVLSHFLVENPSDVHTVLLKTKDAVRPGGTSLLWKGPTKQYCTMPNKFWPT